jgi:hypothetical protein
VDAAGVYWDCGKSKWASAIYSERSGQGGRVVHLGWFVDEVKAALAYDQAARIFYRFKAQLNFLSLSLLQPEGASSEAPTQKRARGEQVRRDVRASRVDWHEGPYPLMEHTACHVMTSDG